MIINRPNHFVFALLVLLSITWVKVNAQNQADIKDRYCIGVNQGYDSWSHCGGAPAFEDAYIMINDMIFRQLHIGLGDLNQMRYFNCKATASSKYVSALEVNGKSLNSITVFYAKIKFLGSDERWLSYSLESKDLAIGECAPKTETRQTDCSYWHTQTREWTTRVYIDDPIYLTNRDDPKARYCLDNENLSLYIGSYYLNGKLILPELQVALDDGLQNWVKLSRNVIVSPELTVNLSYEDIAGRKDDKESHYYLWMGRSLKFRVKKTLLDGTETTGGDPVGSIVFYPNGQQFTILETERTSCTGVVVKASLDKTEDEGYLKIDKSLYRWVVAESVNGETDLTHLYNDCSMKIIKDNIYQIIVKDESGHDPFNEGNNVPLEFKLQLQETKNPKVFYCTRPFTLPAKPDTIKVTQKKPPSWEVNGNFYDVPDDNNPYAMLNIVDSWPFSYKRRPYRIMNGNDTLLTIDTLQVAFENLSKFKRDSLNELFNSEFKAMTMEANSPYKSYFGYRYKQWFATHTVAQVNHPSGKYGFRVNRYHEHWHSHSCTHTHEHEHYCYNPQAPNTPPNGYPSEDWIYVYNHNLISSVNPHDLCDNGHSHIEASSPGYFWFSQNDEHTHTASHSHVHSHSDYDHDHGADPNYNFTVIQSNINGTYSNFSTIYSNVAEVKLTTTGFKAEYNLFKDGNYIPVEIWSESKIMTDVYPDQGVAKTWCDDYKTKYKEKWLTERLGVKLSKGIILNTNQEFKLFDAHGCSYTFPVRVNAPPTVYINIEGITNPTSTCAADGRVTFHYLGGGAPPYIYAGDTLKASKPTITVKNLHSGLNRITFTDAKGFESKSFDIQIDNDGKINVESTPQTCKDANGSVTVTIGSIPGVITCKLVNNKTKLVYSPSTTASPYIFNNLSEGKYTVRVTSGSCTPIESEIVVESKIFDIGKIDTTNATTFNGTGDVTISFLNRTNNVEWVAPVPTKFISPVTGNVVSYSEIVPNPYTITARHIDASGKTCNVTRSFTIDKPQFEAKVNLEETNEGLTVIALLSKRENFKRFSKLRLYEIDSLVAECETNEILYAKTTVKGKYRINLMYDSENVDIDTFSYPLTSLNCTVTVNEPIKCSGGIGSVTLIPAGGFGTGNLKVNTIGLDYTNNLICNVKGGVFIYNVKDENINYSDVYGNKITVAKTLIKQFSEIIPEPEVVSASVRSTDVTCFGDNNGSISVATLKGGSGKYQYQIENGVWYDTLTATPNLHHGLYKVFLKDSLNSCDAVYLRTVEITQPDSLKIEHLNITHPTCELDNGSITVEVKGGNGHYRYEWLLNDSPFYKDDIFLDDTTFVTDTIFNLGDTLTNGLYSLRITDNRSCNLEQSIVLKEYVNPKITEISVVDVKCYGESNGEVKVLSMSGTTPVLKKCYIKGLDFVYSDTIRDMSSRFDTLKKGRYELHVIDTLGCHSDTLYPAVITQPDTLLYLKLGRIQPAIAKGSKTGGVQATVFGGNEGLKEVKITNSQGIWANTSDQRDRFTFTLDSLYADKYSILALDGKGCSDTIDNIEVAEPQFPLQLKVVKKENALCKAQTGYIEVQAEGGWGDYRFKRDSYNAFYSGNKFSNLYAGNYIITVQDKLGATSSDTVAIFEPKDSLRSWVADYTFPTCANNGEIKLSIDGGTPPYQVFNKTNNTSCPAPLGQNLSIVGLAAGDYTMRVTDGNGCLFDVETQLPKTQMLEVSFAAPEYPSAVNSSDGIIHAVTRGGVGLLDYKWKNRFGAPLTETSSSLKNIPSGHYELTVTEKGGCSVTAYTYLPDINDYPFNIARIEDETSFGARNGYCKLTSLFNNWKEFDFITPSNAKVHFNSGASNGQFRCQGDTIFLENLEGGTYFVSGLTTDNNRAYVEFAIKPYTPFVVKSVEVENVKKIGDSNGRIALLVEGGAGNNIFEWKQIAGSPSGMMFSQNSPEGSLLGNVNAGTYQVNVTDRFKNTLTRDLNVEAPSNSLAISIDSIKHASCYTYEDASIYLHAKGGWGDYQFRYDSAKYYVNDTMFIDLDARAYYFYITDKMGVVDSIEVGIKEPDLLISKTPDIDSVNCNGNSDGVITFKICGGTAPYQFADKKYPNLWVIDTIANNIPAGVHEFIITDKNGCICQNTQTVTMLEPDPLLFEKIKVTHTKCEKDNGAIEVQLKGGTKFKKGRTDYKYEWSDFNEKVIGRDSTITKLAQNGYYKLNVYDLHNCHQSFDTTISSSTNPTIVDVDTTPVLCHGGSDGSAFAVVSLGVPKSSLKTYTWSSNASTDSIANGYGANTYSVAVLDSIGCVSDPYSFVVTEPDSLRISITDRKNAQCFGYNDAFLLAQGFGGVGNYTYSWSTGATTNRIENLLQGDYRLSIKDTNQCETVDTFTIIEPEKLEVDLGKDITMCPGNSRVIDGQGFASHKWSNSSGVISDERYLTVRDANRYYLEVTDKDGCFAWDTLGFSIGNDALKSDFILSSQAELGDTIVIFELSNMAIDSVSWYYNSDAFVELDNKMGLDYAFFLKSLKIGIYNIELSAFSGGCISTSTKQIEIIADSGEDTDDDGLGYKDPLIKSFSVNPNPNDGNFYADVKLREISDINLVLFSVVSGAKIEERYGSNLKEYSIGYNLSNLNSGIYLLIVKAGNERKQVKIIIQ